MKNTDRIFEFTDYREYLRMLYQTNKENNPRFSHRVMAKIFGFSSSNFLKFIIDRERHIGKKSINKITEGLKLNKRESDYFSYLVFFAKAKTTVEKNYYFGLIASIRTNKVISPLPEFQFELYNNWYNAVVWELVDNQPVALNYTKIAKKIQPPILPKQVKKSVILLEKLNLIKRTKGGRFVHSSPLLNTDKEVQSLGIKNFHKKMIGFAGDSLDTFPSDKREISSCTIKISQKGFDRIKSRIQEFREEILQIAKDDKNVDRVVQLNLNLFPLTK